MKILFLLKSETTPSTRIRFLDLRTHLAEAGIEPVMEMIPSSFWRKRVLFRTAAEYDAVVLQKRLLSLFDFCELRRYARRLVFDFDDAIYHKNASCSADPADYGSSTRMGKFRRTVRGADMVIAANRILADKTALVNPKVPVTIIPSSVDCSSFKVKTDYNLQAPPVVGWIGTKSTLRYLELVAPAFAELRSKRDFILRIMSNEKYVQPGINVDFVPWSLEAQNTGLCRFDIGIMPLSRDPFSEGKSAYKLLQYLAAGVPSVCSPVGMNADVSGNDEYCLTASDNSQFCHQMERLLDSCELRRSLGRKGRSLIEEKYSIKAVAGRLSSALKSVVENK
ncbi:MAG: hypothetical protein A2X45_25225 [Lentisphaerae bacterium GWF2_50_93]|nr:MAG: hypothetical protein A2X45_25225 [Lentisphaerae bacterium GWF2_50_93]